MRVSVDDVIDHSVDSLSSQSLFLQVLYGLLDSLVKLVAATQQTGFSLKLNRHLEKRVEQKFKKQEGRPRFLSVCSLFVVKPQEERGILQVSLSTRGVLPLHRGLLHHVHHHGSGSRQDEVADAPVVQVENIEAVDGNHKLTDLVKRREN